MTRETAQFILRAARVDGEDQSDPQFAEALEMVKRDPELARWFAEEQAVDTRLARSFGSFPVPPDLKGQLLAARSVIVVPVWRRRPLWLAAAAAIALLLGWLVLPRPVPELAGESFPAEILQLAARGEHVTDSVASLADTRAWLAAQRLPADLPLPDALAGLRFKGCRKLAWRGRPVALICVFDGARHLDLFVLAEPGALPTSPAAPRFAALGQQAVAQWTHSGQTLVLAAHGVADPLELKRYL
jgi:hypothetical protein